MDLTTHTLLKIFEYHPETGVFVRRRSAGACPAGSVAGAINKGGYRQISIANKLHYAHRLVWLIETGSFPIGVLDHVNRVKDDNRISNLREVSHKQNMENTGVYAHNTSGYKGVMWDKQYGQWLARVNHNGKQVFAGRFDTVYDAHQAYERKVAQLFTCR
jgi:hypothetical protein